VRGGSSRIRVVTPRLTVLVKTIEATSPLQLRETGMRRATIDQHNAHADRYLAEAVYGHILLKSNLAE
jgi:hypothetical protein